MADLTPDIYKVKSQQRASLAEMDTKYEAVRDLIIKRNAEEIERLEHGDRPDTR